MDKSKLKNEPLLLEWLQDGVWYGTTTERAVRRYRDWAYTALMENPERYVYINQKMRISYYEGRHRP